jgi:hypothetical protein
MAFDSHGVHSIAWFCLVQQHVLRLGSVRGGICDMINEDSTLLLHSASFVCLEVIFDITKRMKITRPGFLVDV